MEVLHHEKLCKASKLSPEGGDDGDLSSGMPDNVIANIMDRLSIKDAVGTSILSTSWRFKWTLLTQLVFDMNFFDMLARRKIHFDKNNITRLLGHLDGAITKFDLYVTNDIELDDEDIHRWVMSLSRLGGLKELSLDNMHKTPVKLPTHLFPCLELKHLKLRNCVLSVSPYSRDFPKLLSLKLMCVSFQDHQCGELIAQSPLLETLEILDIKVRGGLKLVEIAKLKNIKILYLSLCLLENMTMVRLSSVIDHMSRLPNLQNLYLGFDECEFLAEGVAQNPVSATFPFLKTLFLSQIDFSSDTMLSCAFRILFGCSNLQTLHIATYKNAVPPPLLFPQEVDCSTIEQLQLRMSLFIIHHTSIDRNEKHKLANRLLKLHRASAKADISF
uniref:F-box/FBD/LRR-repeat protein At1g13570-like n=1 Tax=Erigeron canadensis TaxID=72917 RepID=UPI001CB91D38|nr:F-box/FBD/LRR-repeat protein At1g13570-like [Erigeron canadensis]